MIGNCSEKGEPNFVRQFVHNRILNIYLILFHFGAIGSCIENFIMFELRQCFQTEYHNWEKDDKYGDDGNNSGVLTWFRILKQ